MHGVAALQITAGLDLDASLRAPAYSIAGYLLTVLTAKIADELRDTRPSAESALGVVWAATVDEDGPSGKFFRDGHLVA